MPASALQVGSCPPLQTAVQTSMQTLHQRRRRRRRRRQWRRRRRRRRRRWRRRRWRWQRRWRRRGASLTRRADVARVAVCNPCCRHAAQLVRAHGAPGLSASPQEGRGQGGRQGGRWEGGGRSRSLPGCTPGGLRCMRSSRGSVEISSGRALECTRSARRRHGSTWYSCSCRRA